MQSLTEKFPHLTYLVIVRMTAHDPDSDTLPEPPFELMFAEPLSFPVPVGLHVTPIV